jgi:hypothetical protein
MLFNLRKKKSSVQNEMAIAIQQRKLGEPIGDTLFGKTVSIFIQFSILHLLLLSVLVLYVMGHCF